MSIANVIFYLHLICIISTFTITIPKVLKPRRHKCTYTIKFSL